MTYIIKSYCDNCGAWSTDTTLNKNERGNCESCGSSENHVIDIQKGS